MKRALVLSTTLHSITQSRKQPEDNRTFSVDISSFDQKEFELATNDSDGANAASVKALGPSQTMTYFYAPYPVELTLNDTIVLPSFKGLFTVTAGLTLKVRNLAVDRSVVCSAIMA